MSEEVQKPKDADGALNKIENSDLPEDPSKQKGRIIQVQQSMISSGPLPDPIVLEKYEKISPGSADRIISMAEKEQKHRHTINEKALSMNHSRIVRGQYFGLILGGLGIVSATMMTLFGYPNAGIIMGGATVTSLCAIFVLGKIVNNKGSHEEK